MDYGRGLIDARRVWSVPCAARCGCLPP